MPKRNYRHRVRLPNGYPELADLEPYHYTDAPDPYTAFRYVINRISQQRKRNGLNPVYYIIDQLTHSEIEHLVERADDEQIEPTIRQQLRLFD